ncbi:MAG: RNA polymerase sigma factor [Roseomonas sp.]
MSRADLALAQKLKAGDAEAFRGLVRAQHNRLLRLAAALTRSSAAAEEVVQDAWLVVIQGIDAYEGRAPLNAWIAGIVINKARDRARRDGRMISFDAMAEAELEEPALAPERFAPDGHWADGLPAWEKLTPERLVGDRQLLQKVLAALETLPPVQRLAVLLRDVEGLEAVEVCRQLGVTEGNLRVLLHRARNRLREAADQELRIK